jgi:hypothetical protein
MHWDALYGMLHWNATLECFIIGETGFFKRRLVTDKDAYQSVGRYLYGGNHSVPYLVAVIVFYFPY